MVKIYFDLIQAGLRTIKAVPLIWRGEVQAMLYDDENKNSLG